MIERVSNHAGASPAANLTPRAASTKVLHHTPFGNVMVDELSTPNVASILLGGRSNRQTAPAVGQPAALASPEQAAAASGTGQAGVAAQGATTATTATTAQAPVAADTPAQDPFPTAQSVFGDNPWITNPTGKAPDGSTYGYNPLYFATAATAAKVAQLLGGKVVASDQIATLGGFAQQQPNEMVQLPNGTLINAGLVASFYTHGESQACIDQMIQNEIQGT